MLRPGKNRDPHRSEQPPAPLEYLIPRTERITIRLTNEKEKMMATNHINQPEQSQRRAQADMPFAQEYAPQQTMQHPQYQEYVQNPQYPQYQQARKRRRWVWAVVPVGAVVGLCMCVTVTALLASFRSREPKLTPVPSAPRTATALVLASLPGEQAEPTQPETVPATTNPAPPLPPATDTPVPLPTATATPLPQAVVKAAKLNVREGPGTSYDPPLAQAKAGDLLTVLGRALGQPWIKVLLPDGKEGWISAAPEHVTVQVELSALPAAYFRPPSSIIQTTEHLAGQGELEIENNGSSDGLVILARDRDPLVVAYVRASEIYKLERIPDGEYTVFIVSGSDWDGQRFNRDARSSRFEENIPYTTTSDGSSIHYTIWKITLATAENGNAATEHVDLADLPPITPDVSVEEP